MTYANFLDFLTSSPLSVRKIFTVCPQIWDISRPPHYPHVWTSFLDDPKEHTRPPLGGCGTWRRRRRREDTKRCIALRWRPKSYIHPFSEWGHITRHCSAAAEDEQNYGVRGCGSLVVPLVAEMKRGGYFCNFSGNSFVHQGIARLHQGRVLICVHLRRIHKTKFSSRSTHSIRYWIWSHRLHGHILQTEAIFPRSNFSCLLSRNHRILIGDSRIGEDAPHYPSYILMPW